MRECSPVSWFISWESPIHCPRPLAWQYLQWNPGDEPSLKWILIIWRCPCFNLSVGLRSQWQAWLLILLMWGLRTLDPDRLSVGTERVCHLIERVIQRSLPFWWTHVVDVSFYQPTFTWIHLTSKVFGGFGNCQSQSCSQRNNKGISVQLEKKGTGGHSKQTNEQQKPTHSLPDQEDS